MSSASSPVEAPTLVGRPYRGIADLAPMQGLVRVGRRLAEATTSWSPGDFEWWIASGDPAIDWSERVSLWSATTDPERVIAWTWWTPLTTPTGSSTRRAGHAGAADGDPEAIDRPLGTLDDDRHESLVATRDGLRALRRWGTSASNTLDPDDDPLIHATGFHDRSVSCRPIWTSGCVHRCFRHRR
jgi:hypothetical protein